MVMGPAGCGKSTYCTTMMDHFKGVKRQVHLINLDPAAEHFVYEPTIDIRDLISLQDVMEELGYGPNGGLIYCLEYLIQNLDWLEDALDDFEDDYVIIDLPGQIELYTHFTIIKQLCGELARLGYRVCGVYLLDSQFVEDVDKFFSGVMSAMAAMVQLEIPHVNVLTKMDLLGDLADSPELDRFFDVDPTLLLDSVNTQSNPKYHLLNSAVVRLIEEFNMVSFVPLNIKEEETIEYVLSMIDVATQYGEDLEPKEPKENDEDDEEEHEFEE